MERKIASERYRARRSPVQRKVVQCAVTTCKRNRSKAARTGYADIRCGAPGDRSAGGGDRSVQRKCLSVDHERSAGKRKCTGNVKAAGKCSACGATDGKATQ